MEYTTLLLYLLSSTWTHSCNFPHTSGRITVCQRLEKLGLWSTSQFGSGGVKSAPGDQSCLSVDCFLRLSLLLSSLYIKHYDLILPFICSYMWGLITRAHIWCAFGFVLKTGCYTVYFQDFRLQTCHSFTMWYLLRFTIFVVFGDDD